MIPIISVIGASHVGKTTFLEKLIAELTGRGWRVAVIKHATHGFEIDTPGKDSWRHAKAGAVAVAISSTNKLALIRQSDREVSLDDLALLVSAEADLVLTEGYRSEGRFKIEVLREGIPSSPACRLEDLFALVTDRPQPTGVPQFGLDDARGVSDLIEERILRSDNYDQAELLVDGRSIVLKPFAKNVLNRTVRAILSLLDGCEDARDVKLILQEAKGRSALGGDSPRPIVENDRIPSTFVE